jgi:hypothetical protein
LADGRTNRKRRLTESPEVDDLRCGKAPLRFTFFV